MCRGPRCLGAPAAFALRRLRARARETLLTTAAIAAAGVLVGATALAGALAAEEAARQQVAALPAGERAIQAWVRQESAPGRPAPLDPRALADRFSDVSSAPVGMLVRGPVAPRDERGVRVVQPDGATPLRALVSAPQPLRCRPGVCDALALGRRPAVGEIVEVEGVALRVVARTALRPGVRPPEAILRGTALVAQRHPALDAVMDGAPTWLAATAVVDAALVRGWRLDALTQRLRADSVRFERSAPSARTRTPADSVGAIATRIRTARERLLLVGAQAATLLLAFAAFAGSLRRHDTALVAEQLSVLGASPRQAALVRGLEAGLPAAAAALAALAALAVAAVAAGAPHALGPVTLVAVLALCALGGGLVLYATRPVSGRSGAADAVVVVALAVLVWQGLATGGLDPDRIQRESGAQPALLLVPALALICGAVAIVRLLPPLLRALERLSRRLGASARLAVLAAARNHASAAAATAFLAVALGTALFALDYRATLAAHVDDAAEFRAAATWRSGSQAGATPAVRVDAAIQPQGRSGEREPLEVLALPAHTLPAVRGWRERFSTQTPAAIAAGLETSAGVAGPRLRRDTVALGLWVRTPRPRRVTAEFLLPGDRFARLELGVTPSGEWVRLQARVPRALRGAMVVGLTPAGEGSPSGDDLLLGPLRERDRRGRVRTLADVSRWTTAPGEAAFGAELRPARFSDAPVASGARARFGAVGVPLLRPRYPVREPIPALIGPDVLPSVVDNRFTVLIKGRPLEFEAIAASSLFPSVTEAPGRFAVVDYTTLFASLAARRPGDLEPNEAWAFAGKPPPGAISPAGERAAARDDVLALSIRAVLLVTALVAAALAVAGLALAAAAMLRDERRELAEHELLGATRAELARAARLRILLLGGAGVAAALIGALLAGSLVAALVAITAGAQAPLPPIRPRTAWVLDGLVLAAVLGGVVAVTARVTGRALRPRAAGRLRR